MAGFGAVGHRVGRGAVRVPLRGAIGEQPLLLADPLVALDQVRAGREPDADVGARQLGPSTKATAVKPWWQPYPE